MNHRVRAWRRCLVATVLLVAACQSAAPPPPALAIAAAHGSPAQAALEAVLAAGDWEQPVFDNATRTLADRLVEAGVPGERIHLLSADSHMIGHGVEVAALPTLLARIRSLAPGDGGSCLVFLTSHGEPKRGLWLARSDTALTPAQLDGALEAGCGNAPTVVIVSACYSGIFTGPPMRRPNRVIITAARPDRPSFGCQADRTYTYFDECFLGSLDGSATWQDVYARSVDCVARKERAIHALPSEPQAYFGTDAAAQRVPSRRARRLTRGRSG